VHFVIQYRDRPGTEDARKQNHPAHTAFRRGLGSAILLSGPLLADDGEKPVGSLLVLDAADLAQAREIAAADPFVKLGVFDVHSVTPFRMMAINPPAKT
jgi:uncharacterized protein YciI